MRIVSACLFAISLAGNSFGQYVDPSMLGLWKTTSIESWTTSSPERRSRDYENRAILILTDRIVDVYNISLFDQWVFDQKFVDPDLFEVSTFRPIAATSANGKFFWLFDYHKDLNRGRGKLTIEPIDDLSIDLQFESNRRQPDKRVSSYHIKRYSDPEEETRLLKSYIAVVERRMKVNHLLTKEGSLSAEIKRLGLPAWIIE